MTRTILWALFSATLALTLTAATETATGDPQWSQWRGPERNAHVSGDQIAAPGALREVWSVEVGGGQASPVIGPGAGDDSPRVYVHSRWQDSESVAAYDLGSGATVWRRTFEEVYEPYPGAKSFGKGPKSTPALEGGTLCSLSVTGTVACFEAAGGELLWRKSYGDRFEESYPPFGTSMSPLFDAGRLIVHAGGHPAGALMALDPATGDEIWTYDGEGPGYSSPIVATIDGTRQIVTQAHRNIISVDAETGRLLWKFPSVTPCDQNIVTPTAYRDTLIFSSIDAGVYALRPRRAEGVWSVEKTWHNTDWSLYMSSPVLIGDTLAGFSKQRRGQLFALDAATGRERWKSEPGQGSHAALVGSDRGILSLNTAAELVLFEAEGDGFRPAGAARVAEGEIWAHLVPAGDGWLVKGEETLHWLREQPAT